MDTYISGVVRWLDALGERTVISCGGHGPQLYSDWWKTPAFF